MTHAWFDISAGVAGDMMLGALIDAGADLTAVQAAVDSLIPDTVRLSTLTVDRGGQRATKLGVEVLVDDSPHRKWATIRTMLENSTLAEPTRTRALATFQRLAEAEARVHGTDPDQVHFHEVGAFDSITDVVGTCEALRLLGVDTVSASPAALGAGRIRAAHGDIPVPAPAVAQLAIGWQVTAGPQGIEVHRHEEHHHHDSHAHSHDDDHRHGHVHAGDHHHHAHAEDHDHHSPDHRHDHGHHHDLPHDQPAPVTTPGQVGELATPTGLALIRALAMTCEPTPPMSLTAMGVGAGGKDFASHPNVVRVLIGEPSDPVPTSRVIELACNVDDLNPQLWPGVLDTLLAAGALDAWLSPILMKKGRPAHTLHVLARPTDEQRFTELILAHTSTIGVRVTTHHRHVADRGWTSVPVLGSDLEVKVASRNGIIVNATSEFDSLARLASVLARPVAEVEQHAKAALVAAGLVPGVATPAGLRSHR